MKKEPVIYNLQQLPAEMTVAAVKNKAAWTSEIRASVEAAINSDVFMSFDEKINSLLDALRIPISDDQSYNQFFIHSQKDLEGEAARIAVKAQAIPVLPSLDQIHAEARNRYDKKADKLKRKQDKVAAKAAKTAPPMEPEQKAA